MAKSNQKYSILDVRKAIEAAGPSRAAIARELHCSTATVSRYIRVFPEVAEAFERAQGKPVIDSPQYPKAAFEAAIKQSHGVKASVAAAIGCSRQTVDNALERWPELVELLDAARSSLVSIATSALVNDINSPTSDGHVRAYMFVLKTFGKDEGFVERSEVTGADGAALLDVSPDVLKQITDAGLNVAEVLKNFAAMVQQGGS